MRDARHAAEAPVIEPVEAPTAGVAVNTRDTRTFPQERARATYAALIQASAQVFSEKGFDATQTPDIARRAGVSVGTFYRYFADKRQAFIEMIHQYLERTHESVMAHLPAEAFAAGRTAEARRAAVDHVIDVLFRDAAQHPKLYSLFLALSMRDPEVERMRAEFDRRGRDALATLIDHVVPRARIADPLAAAEVIQIAAREVAVATFGARGAPAQPERAGALRSALADMLYRYVFGES